MSLQYYDVSLAVSESKEFSAQGRYVYYLNGTTPLITGGVTPAAAGNQALKIKPAQGGGGEIILMPGQSIRLPDSDKAPVAWRISNYKNAEVITGTVLVGEGEFVDNNTLNQVKLDATFANQVTVTNPTNNRVNVALDPNVILNTAQNIMQYTGSFESAAATTAAVQIVSAAANVNGVDVKQLVIVGNAVSAGNMALVAKASAPATIIDGDMIDAVALTGAAQFNKLTTNVRVPAGKGVYLLSTGDSGTQLNKSVLYSIL